MVRLAWCVLAVLLAGCGDDLALDEERATLQFRDDAGLPCVPQVGHPPSPARADLDACFTLDGERLGRDTASSIGDVHFSLTRWIPAQPEPAAYVGFTLTTDGDVAYVIESGRDRFRGSTAGWVEPSAMIGASTEPISLVAVCPIMRAPTPNLDVEGGGALEWQTSATSAPTTEPEPAPRALCDPAGCCPVGA